MFWGLTRRFAHSTQKAKARDYAGACAGSTTGGACVQASISDMCYRLLSASVVTYGGSAHRSAVCFVHMTRRTLAPLRLRSKAPWPAHLQPSACAVQQHAAPLAALAPRPHREPPLLHSAPGGGPCMRSSCARGGVGGSTTTVGRQRSLLARSLPLPGGPPL